MESNDLFCRWFAFKLIFAANILYAIVEAPALLDGLTRIFIIPDACRVGGRLPGCGIRSLEWF